MSEIRTRFIEAAARPLADNPERRLAAESWVAGVTKDAPEEGMEEAIARWDRLDSLPRKWNWRRIVVIAALITIPALFFPAMTTWSEVRALRGLGMVGGALAPDENLLTRGLDEDQRLLIGDMSLTRLERADRLRRSDPENPAYYIEYAAALRIDRNRLPDDFLETAARIDPDNAWFDLFAASATASLAVEKIPKYQLKPDSPKMRILNEAEYRTALLTLETIRGKERLGTYSEDLMRRRIALLPQATSAEYLSSLAYLGSAVSPFLPMLKWSGVLSCRADELVAANDVEGYREFRKDVLHMITLLARTETSLVVEQMVIRSLITSSLETLHEAGVKLGVDSEDPRVARWHEAFERLSEERSAWRKRSSPLADRIEQQGGMMASLGLPILVRQSATPPPVTADDLRPMRYSDHATVARVSSVILWIVLLLSMLPVFAYRWRASPMVRCISSRIVALLRPADWAWILLGGVIVPTFAVILLAGFTPLGGRELSVKWGIAKAGVFMPAATLILIATLVPLLVLLLARWRLRLRAAMFGFQGRDLIGWLALLPLLIVIPGLLYLHRYASSTCVLVPQLFLTVVAMRALFGKQERVARRLAVSHVLLVALAAAVLCVVPAVWGFGSVARHWFEKDTFMKHTPEAPGLTPYEYKVTRVFRGETLHALEMD